MFIFKPTNTVESRLFPDVKITFRKLTERRRAAFKLDMAPLVSKVRDVSEQIDKLATEKNPANDAQIQRLTDEFNDFADKIKLAKLSWAVAGISGLCLGGEDNVAGVDNMADWPAELIDELIEMIDDATVLKERDVKNLKSPSTSGAVADIATSSTTAPNVDAAASS